MLTLCKVAPEQDGGLGFRESQPVPPREGEIRLKVAAAGICGTDMQIYKWAPRMARRMALPRVMGHEMSGVVETIGPGVTNVEPGDHVSLESHIFCGTCRQCLSGKAHLCANLRYPGIDIDGTFADYITVPAQIAWRNPKGLKHEIAAMMEPFGIAVHASLEGSGVAGQSVLINGCGPIGLMNVATARALGATRVIACDMNPIRLATAEKMGADRAVKPDELIATVKDMTNGGVDVGIEYSGSEAGFRAVYECIAKGGDFRLVGAPPAPIAVDFTFWLLKCPRMINIHGRRIWDTWSIAADLVASRRVDLSPIASHVLPLKDGLRGFELIKRGEAVKPILVPGG